MTPEQKKQFFATATEDEKRDLARRLSLGKEKKLWALELYYRAELNSVARHVMRNRTADEIMKTRETLFSHGFVMFIEPGHWRIIQPKDIVSVDLYKQDDYIDEI